MGFLLSSRAKRGTCFPEGSGEESGEDSSSVVFSQPTTNAAAAAFVAATRNPRRPSVAAMVLSPAAC